MESYKIVISFRTHFCTYRSEHKNDTFLFSILQFKLRIYPSWKYLLLVVKLVKIFRLFLWICSDFIMLISRANDKDYGTFVL